jgi:hypothetical protein
MKRLTRPNAHAYKVLLWYISAHQMADCFRWSLFDRPSQHAASQAQQCDLTQKPQHFVDISFDIGLIQLLPECLLFCAVAEELGNLYTRPAATQGKGNTARGGT